MRMQRDGRLTEESGSWREVSFVHDLGITYIKTVLKGLSNYRLNAAPIIIASNPIGSSLNCMYFNFLSWYRHHVLKLKK